MLRELVLVRHGESEGNVAAARAASEDAEVVDVPARDADVDLSDLGREQATALGAALTPPPDVVVSSPYRRAVETASAACAAAGLDLPLTTDDRLRDRELGVLDRLTQRGVRERHPEEAERRAWLGKYFHRPPGGESWADVALRLRSWLAEAEQRYDGRRVLVVSHDVVSLLVRQICTGLDEHATLDVARTTPLRNASLSRLVREDDGGWRLDAYDVVDHLEAAGLTATEHPGDRDGRA